MYSIRTKAIKACVDKTAENVKRLSAARDSASDAERADAVRELRQEQTKVIIAP